MSNALELVRGVREGRYTQAETARLFNVHPATVSRLVGRAPENQATYYDWAVG